MHVQYVVAWASVFVLAKQDVVRAICDSRRILLRRHPSQTFYRKKHRQYNL